MIKSFQLIRNVGSFDSVSQDPHNELQRISLIYGENGRGKTTISAIFRSLATGDPMPLNERQRMSAQFSPHIVLRCDDGQPDFMFENGGWNNELTNLAVFDDDFINKNVHSGLTVELDQRQGLHELILGSQGILLNQDYQTAVNRIEGHNASLRTKADAIPEIERHGVPVDQFCDLQELTNSESQILASERELAAANKQDLVQNSPQFEQIGFPEIDLAELISILETGLESLEASALEQVSAHLEHLGSGGESWVGSGIKILETTTRSGEPASCPFCAQGVNDSPIIEHYRAYFSEAYNDLKKKTSQALEYYAEVLHGDAAVEFERAVGAIRELREFWVQFCGVPTLTIGTPEITQNWQVVRETIATILTTKQSSPLDQISLSVDDQKIIASFDACRGVVVGVNNELNKANELIATTKSQSASSNSGELENNLRCLQAARSRHTPVVSALCSDYLEEKEAKTETEKQREESRSALNHYRDTVFPEYQTGINEYLTTFNAGFQVAEVSSSAQSRSGNACIYDLIIDGAPVRIAGGARNPGSPGFGNTLSAGDRNTLALAFFFVSLDRNPELANSIVVIDDPMTSLDEHRSLVTVQTTRRLCERAGQVIILSHSKAFLCQIWKNLARDERSALQLTRAGESTELGSWEVSEDSITEHDSRYNRVQIYMSDGTGNSREVAGDIRLLIEGYLRVAYPYVYPPETLLGPFLRYCRKQLEAHSMIFSEDTIANLEDLNEYSSRYHHETNPAYATVESPNDGELRGYAERALQFTSPPRWRADRGLI